MTRTYIKVQTDTGRIIERTSMSDDDARLHVFEGEGEWFLHEGDLDAALWWFENGELVERPTLCPETATIAADGNASFELAIPPGGEVVRIQRWLRSGVELAGGRFVFRTAEPGTYAFEFDCFPYRKQTVTVIAS